MDRQGVRGRPHRARRHQLAGPVVHLSLADRVSLTDGEGGEAELRLPAEALVRLVYGRLDPDHTPALSVTGVDLDDLRRTFPGL